MLTSKPLFILLICLCTLFAYGQNQKYTFDQLHEDFRIFKGALEDSHPGLYWYRSKKEIDACFNEAHRSMHDGMTELEFYGKLSSVISKIGCGHTWVASTENLQDVIWTKGKVLPMKLKFIGSKAYCFQMNSADSTSIKPGDEILSINGYAIDSLISISNYFSPGDGFIQAGKLKLLDKVFNQFYTLYIGRPDTYTVEYKNETEAIGKTEIQALPIAGLNTSETSNFVRASPNLKVDLIPEKNAALLTIREFSDWKIDRKKFQFKSELQKAFLIINSAKAENLIIDVRDNDGGNEKYGLLLFSYLTDKSFIGYKQIDFRSTRLRYRKYSNTGLLQYWFFKALLKHKKVNDTTYLLVNDKSTALHPPSQNPFRGKIFVLINGASFSTTSDFTALVKDNKVGILIGGETGGSYSGNSSNYELLITLPHTKIKVAIPLARYQTNVSPGKYFGRGTLPDYEIQNSIDDYLTGKDSQMSFVLDLIKNR